MQFSFCSYSLFPPYMGGCIGVAGLHIECKHVSSLHGRVYRSFINNLEAILSFLPTWEGVSKVLKQHGEMEKFPPYMGGCIGYFDDMTTISEVSSLHGRVYQIHFNIVIRVQRFLPTWEGVSRRRRIYIQTVKFPPYMGGCIVAAQWHPTRNGVSSLYGKVYRKEGIPSTPTGVSSLYGRVYRTSDIRATTPPCFLPVREGVSLKLELVGKQFKFPPCMGGCIEVTVENLQLIIISSLYGRVYR